MFIGTSIKALYDWFSIINIVIGIVSVIVIITDTVTSIVTSIVTGIVSVIVIITDTVASIVTSGIVIILSPLSFQCSAIDYTLHTLHGAASLLNSNKHFPSRYIRLCDQLLQLCHNQVEY